MKIKVYLLKGEVIASLPIPIQSKSFTKCYYMLKDEEDNMTTIIVSS